MNSYRTGLTQSHTGSYLTDKLVDCLERYGRDKKASHLSPFGFFTTNLLIVSLRQWDVAGTLVGEMLCIAGRNGIDGVYVESSWEGMGASVLKAIKAKGDSVCDR